MKNALVLFSLVGIALLGGPALAQDQQRLPAPEPAKPPDPAKPPGPAKPPKATVDLYVTLLPFIEYVDVTGPSPRDFAEAPDHIGTATVSYNGVDGPPRGRMTSGTSHFGIRGSLLIAEQFRVVGQFETAMAIDGDPNPWESDIPNRNSYLGFTGDWGTVAYGMLDTPYKWITLTTINPIKGGYVPDYTPIIGTPGFLVTALNPVQRWGGSGVSNAAFYRREANSAQYWSPTLFGFYGRVSYTLNEFRPAEEEGLSVRSNPYIVSIAGGFDFEGLRLRYAWESHHDYFGLGYIIGATAPSFETRTANDWGNKAVLQYTLTINPNFKTRVAGIGEHLKYTTHATLPGEINRYERPAFYALLEQTVFQHHVWGAYGKAYPGSCGRVGGGACSTAHVGAQLLMAGYLFEFTEKVQAFLMGYRLINDRSGLYVTAPALPREGLSPGVDTAGVGVGLYYAFGADLLQ